MSDPEHDPEHDPVKDLPGLGAFLALGTTIATFVALGLWLGILADNAWHVAPWGLLAGLVLGAAISVRSVLTLVRRWL